MKGIFDIFKKGSKIVENGMKAIDSLILTKEEKIKYSQELAKMNLDFVKLTQEENTVRSITRRFVAKAIIFTYLGLVLLGVGVFPFLPLYSAFIFEVVGELSIPFFAVVTFFFGNHIATGVMNKINNKKK